MAAPYINADNLIDGAGEIFVLDNVNKLATHGSTACTTTVLTMVSDPRVVFKVGDIIKVATGGTDYQRISALSATTITLDTALSGAPATGVDIYVYGACLGATQGGIALETQTSVQERNVDQVMDAVSIKGDKRSASLKVPLVEVFSKSLQIAFGLPASAVTVSGALTTVSVGSSTTTLNDFAFLITGSREDGSKVTIFVPKAVNTGNTALKFDKQGNSVFQLDMRLIHDSAQAAGEELFKMKIGAQYYYAMLIGA
jgi:hypothetical protein